MEKCIEGLERNQWFKRRHTSDIEPTRAVDNYHKTNSQFLSSSHGTAELMASRFHQPQQQYPPPTGPDMRGGGVRDYSPSIDYPEVFPPHPPYLPNSTNPSQINNTSHSPYMDMSRPPYRDVSHPSYRDMPHNPSYHAQINTNPANTLPVRVPYTESAKAPTYTKQLSEAGNCS